MPRPRQVLVIGGGTTYADHEHYLAALRAKEVRLEWLESQRDWKNELASQLGDGFTVYTPSMPNKTNAEYAEWKILFEKIVPLLDDGFLAVGHSLGGLFLVKYLSENEPATKIGRLFLLGTPFDDASMPDEPLFSFRLGDLAPLEPLSDRLYFYHSRDDFVVPYENFQKYQAALPGAHFRSFEHSNHFLVEEIPELLADLKA
jgi:predicted alpha/beta hydrolase family esterase